MTVVELYKQHKDFKKAVLLSGLPALTAHIKLMKSGVLEREDAIRYGAKHFALGGEAERQFQELVPNAINANEVIKKNNPGFDFLFGDLTIDIKYSSMHVRDKRVYWEIRVSGPQDMIVAFIEKEKGYELKDAHILMIPRSLIGQQEKLYITKGGERFKAFHVKRKDVQVMLKEYEELKRYVS